MKYVLQFSIILACSFGGEALKAVLPLPIPACIYGLVLLFLLLCTKILKTEQVGAAAYFLIGIIPLLLVPPTVGLVEYLEALKKILLPFFAIIMVSTVVCFGITGVVAQNMVERGRVRSERSK